MQYSLVPSAAACHLDAPWVEDVNPCQPAAPCLPDPPYLPAPPHRTTVENTVPTHQLLQKPTTFFDDEWRNPTYVADLVAALAAALALHEQEGQQKAGQQQQDEGQQEAQQQQQQPQQRVFNVGGPARMNRVDMALAVAAHRGYDPALVLPGSAASVARTCATPADISMDSAAVQHQLGVRLTPYAEALQRIFGGGGSS